MKSCLIHQKRKKTTPRYDNSFKKSWTSSYPFIKASRKGVKHCFCELCRSDFSISHGGLGDVTRHISTDKHKSNAKDVETSQSLSMFASGSSKRSIAQSVIHAETLFQGFVTEHNLPLAINDHFSKLTRRMFPDSEIAKQYSCARTKSTHIIYAIAADSIETIKGDVVAGRLMYSLATDGSSDEEDKFFPIIITHEDVHTGLVTTSFIDMPVVNMATGENITTAMKKSLGDVGLDLQQCLSFSTDNASVMTGRHKGVLGLLHQENPQIYGIGCACHLSALAAKHGSKALKHFNPEDFIIDIYYHFEKR